MRVLTFCLWVFGAMIFAAGSASAQTAGDGAAFQKIIKNQMNAFQRGDAAAAYSFATRSLQQRFQNPEFFMQMVKQGYQPVYRPQSVTFGSTRDTPHGPMQEVYVTGPKGGSWLALYSFELQEDGSWRISGCYLTKSPGVAA
ncbi:uncharacterized protein DUF4864 [Roseibium hamelinense]|uniref:Uncharacterized protein DUF4864 n=1 Tax=Roseibium hamelinense TaxID=150831 RepID=A0A562TJP8_9HYPH|nr:DUF4864 domain-containing protein [Roseibium hamelinense]MTI45787.1 DUF4864 domain-containing protein [Roseibium hamelinense]TWI93030.1 uncharacterized protein DUF4864 [Roseibium hamelinense]